MQDLFENFRMFDETLAHLWPSVWISRDIQNQKLDSPLRPLTCEYKSDSLHFISSPHVDIVRI